MKAGLLNKRVTLQSPSGSRDAVGERTTTWTNEATVWARVRPLSAKELMVAAQQQTSTDHAVEIRYLSTVTAAWRVLFGTRNLIITGIVNDDEANVMQTLYCTESARTE